jgi:GUN4-like
MTSEKPSANLNPGDDLSSDVGMDYTRLRNLLQAGKWKEADKETETLMLQVAGREKTGWLDFESIKNFPCTDLCTIDKLWLRHSNGHFGFSVQKCIWDSIGGKPDADYETYKIFGDRLGWRENNKWLNDPNLTFTKDSPGGAFPCPLIWSFKVRKGWFWLVGGRLLSRIKACGVGARD